MEPCQIGLGDALGVLGFTYELRPNGGGLSGFDLDVSQIIDACEENYNGAVEMILWASDASIQSGCMDPTACNYDPQSTVDDGSCAALDECGNVVEKDQNLDMIVKEIV